MDEKRKLRVLDKTDDVVQETVKEPVRAKFVHPNHTNPIFKHLAKFSNAKIGNKLSIDDLLR